MPKKILIADDEEEIIELLKAALVPAGYQVISITYGGQLPKLARNEKPDLLIMDVMMPGLDGYSLMLEISQDEALKSLPVFVMTAMPATKQLFERFPQVKAFLQKPFDPMQVLAQVKETCGTP